jgi:hypothetical protein
MLQAGFMRSLFLDPEKAEKVELFITTAVRTSNPISSDSSSECVFSHALLPSAFPTNKSHKVGNRVVAEVTILNL